MVGITVDLAVAVEESLKQFLHDDPYPGLKEPGYFFAAQGLQTDTLLCIIMLLYGVLSRKRSYL
jgi:hypothetical protein